MLQLFLHNIPGLASLITSRKTDIREMYLQIVMVGLQGEHVELEFLSGGSECVSWYHSALYLQPNSLQVSKSWGVMVMDQSAANTWAEFSTVWSLLIQLHWGNMSRVCDLQDTARKRIEITGFANFTRQSYNMPSIIYSSGSQTLSDRGPVNSFFHETRARYNWCHSPVPDRGPAVRNTAL
jgi:hypothetical protein